MEFIQIEVASRKDLGTSHTRRLRRSGQVPAVLYGMGKPNLQLAISDAELNRFLKTGSHLVELRLGDQTRPAIIREVQYDAVSDGILHVDFSRVDADQEVEDHVALNFKGRAKGEGEGGVFSALKETIAVACRPRDLPREFLLDISGLSVGDSLRVADLETPPNVRILDDVEELVAQCALPKHVPEEPVEGEEEAVEGAEGAEAAPEAASEEAPSE
jgi:large subunit ribosomal protein L25